MTSTYYIAALSVFFLFFACSKNEISTTTIVELDSKIDINKINFVDSCTGYLCGGASDLGGFLYKTTDAGETWSVIHKSERVLNSFSIYDSLIAVCGDSNYLAFSTDETYWDTTTYMWTYWSNDQSDIQDIYIINSNTAIGVGNRNRERGNVYFSENNNFHSWKSIQGSNGLNKIIVTDSDSILLFGYGIIQSFSTKNYTFTRKNLTGDYFTGATIYKSSIYCCGYDSGIYISKDNGESWKQLTNRNNLFLKNTHFNDIAFSKNGIGYTVGEKGTIFKTIDEGEKWIQLILKTKLNLNTADIIGNRIVIGSDEGILYFLEI